MSVDDAIANSDISAVADGMISLLKQNLVSNTVLIQDAHIGDTAIYVDNNLRFDRNNNIVLMGNNSVYNPDAGEITGMEFHIVRDNITETNKIVLKEPLEKDFLVENNGRIQKAIKNGILFAKDILYGDREVIPFDYIAITVDSEKFSSEWLALRMMSDEFRLGINIYVKNGGTPEEEELNMRIRDAYANAIYNLLMGNIHLDVALEDTLLKEDAIAGTNYVYISASDAANWQIDPCWRYNVQDNFGANQDFTIVDCDLSSNSSSSSSFTSPSNDIYTVCLGGNLSRNFLVKDKAVLRRINRYMYDSRASDIEYGVIQKGSTILKAAKISWWGKESRDYYFPQVGKGGST